MVEKCMVAEVLLLLVVVIVKWWLEREDV